MINRIASFLKSTSLWITIFLLTFVICETMSRVYLMRFANEDIFKRFASFSQIKEKAERNEIKLLYRAHRYIGYGLAPNYKKNGNRHNSLGFRGEEFPVAKPENEFRIVTLGGSTTYTVFIDDYTAAYPYQLQKSLREQGAANVRVVNAGVGGYGSVESLASLQFRVLEIDPDMIIIYHSINEAHLRLVWPPSSYRAINQPCRGPVSGFVETDLIDQSTLIRMILIYLELKPSPSSFQSSWWRPKFPVNCFARHFALEKKASTYPTARFAKASAMDMVKANPPIHFERNVRSMIAIAQAHNIKVVVLSFATSLLFLDLPRVASDEYKAMYRDQNAMLKRVSNETGAHFFDFASVFPPDKDLYFDGRHLTKKGAAHMGWVLSKHLITQGLVRGGMAKKAMK